MKYLLLLTTLLYTFTIFSQSMNETDDPVNDVNRFYISIGAGYGFPFNKGLIGEQRSSTDYKGVYGSYGQGIYLNIAPGLFLTDNISTEIGISYLKGSTIKTSNISSFAIAENNYEGTMIQIKPAITIQFNSGTFSPYAKFGAIIGKGKIISTDEYNVQKNTYSTLTVSEFTGGIATGITSALGINWSISPRLIFFSEININTINYMPERMEVVRFERNGQNELESMTTKQRITIFSKDIEEFNAFDNEKPHTALGEYQPFSSIGLNLGMQFMF